MDSSSRDRLIEAGLRLLDSEGPEALQARKIAAELPVATATFGQLVTAVERIVTTGGVGICALGTVNEPGSRDTGAHTALRNR